MRRRQTFRSDALAECRRRAGVVELADTGDLKSPALQGAYGFDPRLRSQEYIRTRALEGPYGRQDR